MTLTEQQIKIIAERPLNDALDRVRDKLRDDADDPRQEDIANLVGALALSPAAFSLPSPDGSGSVAVKLFPIIQHVREGVVKLNQFRPFVRYIVNNSLDFII
ncbi:serine/threonine-protein kinase Sgk2 [Nemania serpens]|nr:serine/threonine-protein kinase Sgk2 [Nemania serpens]